MTSSESTSGTGSNGLNEEIPHSETPPEWVKRVHQGFDLSFIFLGSWTLYCWTLVLLEGSFNLLVYLAWIPVLATALFAKLLNGKNLPSRPILFEPLSPTAGILAVLPALVIVALYKWSGSYTVYWALAIILLFTAQHLPARFNSLPLRDTLSRESWIALVCLCALAVLITLTAHRSDDDDSFYVNLIVTALDRPYEALLSHDGMFGEKGLNLFNPWYRMKSFEPLVATISQLTGTNHFTLYYLVFPAFTATLAVVATWLALRVLGGPMAAVGTLVVIIVIAAWGDVHTSIGNHGFVRLYQSKGVMLTLCVPAAVYYAVRFARNQNTRNWLLLCFCQVAALGISGSAILAVPTTVMAVLIGWYLSGRKSKSTLWGMSSIFLLVPFIAVFMIDSIPYLGTVSSIELGQWLDGTRHGLSKALGVGYREGIALFVILLAPLIAPKSTRRGLIFYVLALLILIVNPLLPGIVGDISERGTWRLFWSVPFPLMLGLVGQRIATLEVGSSRATGFVLVGLLAIAYIFVPGKWTLSPDNRPNGCHPGICEPWYIGTPQIKVPRYHELAGAIVRLSGEQDLVLAPYIISMWVPTYRHHPRLVRVRWYYGEPLMTLSFDEQKARHELGLLVSNSAKWSNARVSTAVEYIRTLGVDNVVFPTDLHGPKFARMLIELGCVNQTGDDRDLVALNLAGYQMWRCL